MIIDSAKVRQNFSRAASTYEERAQLQFRIGERLLERIREEKGTFSSILDIGCGTGRLTLGLKECFPHARVVGIDPAEGMLKVSRRKSGITVLGAEAEHLPFRQGAFDLVVSNLSLQWTQGLQTSIDAMHTVLSKKGRLFLTVFVQPTLKELREVIREGPRPVSRQARSELGMLPRPADVGDVFLKERFPAYGLRVEEFTESFTDLFHLLRWLKAVGAGLRGSLGFPGRRYWEQLNQLYQERFGNSEGVSVTFSVLYLEAAK